MKDYVDWVRERALPVWATNGFDAGKCRFVERLDPAGRPLAVPHRAMVQARQIYVYAHAAALGWFPVGGALAEAAMASLRRDYLDDGAERASVAFAIDPASGHVSSATRDSYTHAFVLFAIAHLYQLNGDPALPRLAERITAFLDRDMMDPLHGGVMDAISAGGTAAGETKRQNPQMHLLEAYLALEQAMPGRGWLERADCVVALFHDRMAHAGHGVLPEYFTADWAAHPEPAMAHVWEPGHHYEWAWLLDRHGHIAGRDHTVWFEALHKAASSHGHVKGGLIVDEVDAAKQVTKTSHRLWPHTEAIKAAVVRHRRGDPTALPFARRMATVLMEHFLDRPFLGGWTDQISSARIAAVGYVPASSLYHLVLAATVADTMDDGTSGAAAGAPE